MTLPENFPGRILTNHSNWFANDTMTRRVPDVIKDIQARNSDYPATIHHDLERLSRSIQDDDPVKLFNPIMPDFAAWRSAVTERDNLTWLNTDWFFAETYFYRCVIEMTRWWETGRDPFLPNKNQEYASDALWQLLETSLQAEGDKEEKLTAALHLELWGNRIDLSFATSMAHGTAADADDLLIDNTAQVVWQLTKNQGVIHLITDNTGTELAMDLALLDLLLQDPTQEIIVHTKMHPTFVSDATPTDIWHFLSLARERGGIFSAFADRLTSAFNEKRLHIFPHFFWNSSRSLWEMPPALSKLFSDARLVIVKGDANYRRILGDALWDPTTPFEQIMAYFPAPLVALRTLKSDIIVGLPEGKASQLDQIDPKWRYNGKRGVIQYFDYNIL